VLSADECPHPHCFRSIGPLAAVTSPVWIKPFPRCFPASLAIRIPKSFHRRAQALGGSSAFPKTSERECTHRFRLRINSYVIGFLMMPALMNARFVCERVLAPRRPPLFAPPATGNFSGRIRLAGNNWLSYCMFGLRRQTFFADGELNTASLRAKHFHAFGHPFTVALNPAYACLAPPQAILPRPVQRIGHAKARQVLLVGNVS